jgi:integrase
VAGFLAAVSPKTRPGLGGPDLRHSYASLLIAQGEHPRLIAEQLGHASVQITLDRHGHLMPGSYDHAGDRLEAALFGFAGPPA